MTGQEIVTAARGYLGVPYFHCGRNRNGLDCLGLLTVVAHDLGLTEYDVVDYSKQVDAEQFRAGIERFCDPVEGPTQTGDILLFAAHGNAQHVGIATEDGARVIHCTEVFGGVVEHSMDKTWTRILVRVYRWRDLWHR